MGLSNKIMLLIAGIVILFCVTFLTIFSTVSSIKYDFPNILMFSFAKTITWFFCLSVVITISFLIIALRKLIKGSPSKKSFVFTGSFVLISVCLFFGIGLIVSQFDESATRNDAVKTFSEEEVDSIIDDNDKKVKSLEKEVSELKEFKSNKNYYDKLKSYNSLKKFMTYDEVVAAFDGEKGEGTTENINNTKNKTFIWDLYTEEVICRFSYDSFKKAFVLTSFLKQKKP